MKKSIVKASFLMLSVLFGSCNNTETIKITEPPKEVIVNINSEIEGDLSELMHAKNERINITFSKQNEDKWSSGFEYEIPVKIVFDKSEKVKSGQGYNNYGPTLDVRFLDDKGRELKEIYANMLGSYDELARKIKTGGGKEDWVEFKGRFMSSTSNDNLKESQELIDELHKIKSIQIISEIIEEEFEDASSSSNNSNFSSSSSASSGDCEAFLDDYEEIVMEYASIAKKVKNDPSNLSYMSELSSISEKASKIQGNLNDCSNDPEIIARMSKLQMKMANALN